jgi:AcrR family transcriptional regulator
MNDTAQPAEYGQNGTADTLIQAARELFAEHGYEGTSVRAITARAGANLGAITYHFGSKRALYEAVISTAMASSRERFASAAARAGDEPLDQVEAMVRVFFDFLQENPDLPVFMAQQLTSPHPIPRAALETIGANIALLSSLIAEGQASGSIRFGEARFMALSIAAQPIWLTLARRALRDGQNIDQDDPATRARLVQSVVDFVRAGLAAHPETLAR